MSPVRCELGSYIPEDILYIQWTPVNFRKEAPVPIGWENQRAPVNFKEESPVPTGWED
jgi:hypothetical protein